MQGTYLGAEKSPEPHADQPERQASLAELRDKLKEHGVRVGIGTLWRFFKRRKITRKKRRRMPQSNVAAR
jgi:transposase